jgi:hypothetical protein
MAHSFVRGNWRSKAESTPMILAKCCHDLDIMVWNLGRECTRISSVGNLNFYQKKNAPAGSTTVVLDGCAVEATCPWSAERIVPRPRAVARRQLPSPSTPAKPPMSCAFAMCSATTVAMPGASLPCKTAPMPLCISLGDNDVVEPPNRHHGIRWWD